MKYEPIEQITLWEYLLYPQITTSGDTAQVIEFIIPQYKQGG